MFDVVNRQRARQELDFVVEDFARRGARQKDGVDKATFAEWQVERRGTSVFERDGLGADGRQRRPAENDRNIGELERRLIYHDGGLAVELGERHQPGPVLAAAILDPIEHDQITDQGDQE